METDSARIAKEEIECQAIATDAQADLDVALPALERAMAEVRLSILENTKFIEATGSTRRGHRLCDIGIRAEEKVEERSDDGGTNLLRLFGFEW